MNTIFNSVPHWFTKHDFGSGFSTNNSILNKTPFDPELLIIGTYNPKTSFNNSDFFYHRNYFWPTMANLLIYKDVYLVKKRIYTSPNNPSLSEILMMCDQAKMTFADLIRSTFHQRPHSKLLDNTAIFEGKDYNLISDNALAQLDELGQVDWSSDNIVEYIRTTPSIRCVRFSRQPTGVWGKQWSKIIDANYGRPVNFGTIHTPSGMGLQEKKIPVAKALARRWLFHHSTDKRFSDQWIQECQIPTQNFFYSDPAL